MRGIGILENCILDYAWGSTSEIPRILGIENPMGRPMAEMWMGAHPKAPSWVLRGKDWVPLNRLIEKSAEDILGRRGVHRFGRRLPFLFKVLAASEPLSLQAHPDLEQAMAGFERENRMGLAIDSERRSFRDAGHKPELLCALTPFRAMCGFRRPEDIRELLARLCPQELAPELEQFEGGCHAAGLARLFRALLKIKGASPDRCRRVVSEARRNAGRLGGLAGHWVMELAGRFTDDIGVLSPALLNVLELNPGQALFLPAGIIHAYLSGTGVEIMANSDNVVRGGLTPKHMDVDLLMSVLSFESHFGHRVEPEDAGPCEKAFPTPAEEFALSAIRTRPEAVFESKKERPVEILLCTEGAAVLEPCDDAGPVDLLRGVSVLVPAAAAAYRLKGDATVFKATLP